MYRLKLIFTGLFLSLFLCGQSMLITYPDNALQGGVVLNLLDVAYGPGCMVGYSYSGMVDIGIQYSFLFEKDGNYRVRNLMPYIRCFPLKPLLQVDLQPSLEFYYLDENYDLKNFYVENNPRRFFYRIGGSFSYKLKMREGYTVIPELGVFRTLQKLEGINLRVEGAYPVHFIYNSYRDTNRYVEVKFSFSLIRPLSDTLDLVIKFQNFMNRDEFQDQFLIFLVGYF
jgi:hypothetical protein